jgi:rRNA maturation endonuclease Nob1
MSNKYTNLDYIPISQSFMCANCDTVYHMLNHSCPCCGSEYYISLNSLIGCLDDRTNRKALFEMEKND